MRPRPQGAASEIDATSRKLEAKVGGFEGAWEAVRKSCDTLQTQLALADTVTVSNRLPRASTTKLNLNYCIQGSLPYYASCLENARRQYIALRECMTAYAQGRAPNL